ncbi:lytic transglycosylase domain-containing protein [Microbaculum marinisediminis]|uniref:Lytic transglycosylase domain-containing protein n=1 Tax=Microbaculum marinisediminis TaxID=2931392 RepID=A0AAW5R6N9_9HYPH|nr:lytic transglycosylase domain-containing protein [Microbaculum sp. A6E488]MCT8974757.1 lytic transglycosylase domain-containing protein [Microbaculum sp. A6E488]
MSFFSSFGLSGGKPGDVGSALQYASRRTGVDVDYLKATAKRESNLDPQAKAPTSSATGLFQFIERTWLGMLKQAGGRHGYGELAEKIQPTAGGGYAVSDAAARRQILELREDPKAAALMAGEFTARNAETLQKALGRHASEGELYAAHFLGAGGAVELVRLVETAPGTPAAERFPAAARANRAIFYDSGRARTAREVYAKLTAGYDATPAVPQNATYLAFAPGRSTGDQAFHGLFRSDSQGLGPIGRMASSFWAGVSGKAEAHGMTRDPGSAMVETDRRTGQATIRLDAAPQADGRSDLRSDTRSASAARDTGEAGGRRSYGQWSADPSLPVR